MAGPSAAPGNIPVVAILAPMSRDLQRRKRQSLPRRAPAGRANLPALVGLAALVAAGAAWVWSRDPAPAPAGSAGPQAAGAPQPNGLPVVVYLIDTLRADRLGLYGYQGDTSPVLDALARESVVFEQAHGAAPWTLPSVASLLTSTFACEHGVVRYRQQLSPALPTLAERLGAAGYATGAYYGNVHAGAVARLNRGYDVAEERKSGENDRSADVREFLAARGDDPFFLYLHTMEPHEPCAVPARYLAKFGHVSVEDREDYRAIWHRYNELKSADWAARQPLGTTDNTAIQLEVFRYLRDHRDQVSRLYDAAVRNADDNLGRVIEALKAAGAWDKVLFIVVADHGEELGDHGGWFHDQSVYQELVHVPLLVRFPGGAHGGRRVREPVSLVDVAPTVLDAAGLGERCAECRGRSLLPLATGGTGATGGTATAGTADPPAGDVVPALRINEIMYFKPFRETRGDVNVVVRRDRWKGIWNADPGTLELYDLEADPGETRDLAGANPALAGELRESASRWLAACRDAVVPPDETRELDERTRERLRAIGYLD